MTKVSKSARLLELEQRQELLQTVIINILVKNVHFPENFDPEKEHISELFIMYRDIKSLIEESEI